MVLIAASTLDLASRNIAESIIALFGLRKLDELFKGRPMFLGAVDGYEVKLIFIEGELVEAQYLTEYFKPGLTVFASRHESKRGLPTLSVHAPGNIGSMAFGGLPRRVSIAPAGVMKNALIGMAKERDRLKMAYDVSYECTHHGPSLDSPAMFIEIGSSEREWRDPKASEAIAKALMEALKSRRSSAAALGIGGPHYNKKFTEIGLKTELAFGHIISKHAIPYINKDLVKQCIERTLEKVAVAVLDWKGVHGPDRVKIIKILEDEGVKIIKV